MSPVRLGAVEYLNARPLVFGLQHSSRFSIRFDVPSRCAELLHRHEIDVGLIPSIEYLRGPRDYRIVPGPAVTSRGAVASVALFTTKEPGDIRTIAMDTSSRTSVALALIITKRWFGISPKAIPAAPNLAAMLSVADAALVIGDHALFLEPGPGVEKIDLGAQWTKHTGLPFVYAFWAGWSGSIGPSEAEALQLARDNGAAHVAEIAHDYAGGDSARELVVDRYLRDNIQYSLGGDEVEGLTAFYRYAAEDRLVNFDGAMNWYDANSPGTR